MRGEAARLAMFLADHHGVPGRFGDQQQRVEVGNDADFMPLNLVAAPAFVLRPRGGEALVELQPAVLRTRAPGAVLQLALIVLKVIIDALQFATQVVLLADPDGSEVGGQFLVQQTADPFVPNGQVERAIG